MPTKPEPEPTTSAKALILSRLYAGLVDAISRRDDADGCVVKVTGRMTGSGIVFEEGHLAVAAPNQWLQDVYNANGMSMGFDLDVLLTNAVTRIEKAIEAAKKIT